MPYSNSPAAPTERRALQLGATAHLSLGKLVTARFDALRTGLSVGLGGGGVFALYLAWRRQHSTEIGLAQKQQDQADVARAYELQRETFETTRLYQERVAAATERDAEARRITDLYTKAVEQLGSDKAPVRLGGLYALERLAQATPHSGGPSPKSSAPTGACPPVPASSGPCPRRWRGAWWRLRRGCPRQARRTDHLRLGRRTSWRSASRVPAQGTSLPIHVSSSIARPRARHEAECAGLLQGGRQTRHDCCARRS